MISQRQIPADPHWVEQVKPDAQDATPRTMCTATPMSPMSRFSPSMNSFDSIDDLGDLGSFEKLFASIPEHFRPNAVNFYDNQLDWSADGVPRLYEPRTTKLQGEEMMLDWSTSRLPTYKPDFWEYQRDWSQNGLPITKEMPAETTVDWSVKGIPAELRLVREIRLDWSPAGMPFVFRSKRKPAKQGEEQMVNWCKRGVPVKNSWWYNPTIDWSQDRLPEVWEKATTAEINFMSFMPGPYRWSRPSFWEMPTVDWCKNGLPRIFRKVCEKPSAPRDEVVDWSTRGLPIAFRRLESQAEKTLTVDWSTTGVPVTTHFLERGLDWSVSGVPTPFGIGARYAELPVCDWSTSGLPMQLPRTYSSDDELAINWSHTGLPKQFRSSVWDELQLDWSGSGVPRSMRSAPDRFNYVYAKRVESFFRPSVSKKPNLHHQLCVDWNVKGIPSELKQRREPKQSEELCLDWSCRLPPSPYRPNKWDNLAIDWTPSGAPCFEEKASKWAPLVIDWSEAGQPQKFRMAPQKFWDGPSLDWTQAGIPSVFNANVGREELMYFDWSVQGIPRGFKHMGKCERPLSVDWLSPGLPVMFKFWNQTYLDWNAEGIPSVFNAKGRKNLRQSEELMINWSKRGIPREFHTTKWDFFAIDWSDRGLLSFEKIPFAKRSNAEQYYVNLDWSLTGLPVPSKLTRFRKYVGGEWVADWSNDGVPMNFMRDDPPPALDWSTTGMPYQLKRGEFEALYSLDWAVAGIPTEFKEPFLDAPYMDWSATGVPRIFNVKPAKVTCRICRLNPQPIQDYVFDWGASGVPIKTTFFDYPMFDWSTKGLPLGGQPQSFTFDWSSEGVPYPSKPSNVFTSDPLKLSELLEPRLVTTAQQDLCFEASDMHLMTTVHVKQSKTDVFNPWNRLTDNRREAKFLAQARRTKKTKRVERYLRYIQSNLMEAKDRAEKKKYLTIKRSNQRVDKRTRRGDTPYAGQEFIDEYPVSSFFDLWPHALVAQLHQMDIEAMN